MKRKSTVLGLSLALALSGLWSCEKDTETSDVIDNGKKVTLTLKSDLGDATRTSISYDEASGKYKPVWEAGEHIGVFVSGNDNTDFENGEAGQTTQFIGQVSLDAGTHKVYTYYPFDNTTNKSNTASDTRITLPSVQNPTLSSFDGAADIMVGYPLDLTLSAEDTAPLLEGLQFKRLMATLQIIPSEVASQIASEPVLKMRLTAGASNKDAILTGRVKLDLTECMIHADGFGYSSDTYKLNYVEAQYDAAADFQLDGKNAAFVVVNPTAIAAGKTLTLEIETATHKITKTVTLPSEMTFAAGEITPLRMNLATGTTIESTATGLSLPFEDDFAGATGAGSAWSGNDKFAASGSVYQDSDNISNKDFRDGAIRIGSGSATGSITTKDKLNLSTPFTIIVQGCGWSASENELDIIIGEQTRTVTFTTNRSDYAGEKYYIDFDPVGSAETVKFAKSGSSRCIIDAIIIESATDPKISAEDIKDVPATGVIDATATYTVKNFTDDVSVSAFAGNVTAASASAGTITYTVAPNYSGAEATGSITLSSASAPEVTINVKQAADAFAVSPASISLGGATGDKATFTVNSTYAWTISTEGTGYTVSPEAGEAGQTEITVTASADGASDEASLGTITVTRTPDSKTASVAVSQLAAGGVMETWNLVETAEDVTAGEYVITHKLDNGSAWYYLPNTAATNACPKAISGIQTTNSTLSTSVTNEMIWVVETSGSGFKVSSKSDNTYTLCFSSTNNGNCRINTTGTDFWTFENDATKGLVMKSNIGKRYLCVYNGNDWRGYTSPTATNNQGKLYLFKKTN